LWLLRAAAAVAAGLVVGLEREHHQVAQHEEHSHLGVRTFALLGLLGYAAAALSGHAPGLSAATLLVAGGALIAQYLRTGSRDPGLTTEIAALVTVLAGMLVDRSPLEGIAIALGTTVLLVSKPWFGSFVPKLRRAELTSTLQLLILAAVVLPLLPAQPVDPWHVLAPRRIGIFVVVVSGINYLGYVLVRWLGARRGAGLIGLFGGLASSTGVALTMSRSARKSDAQAEQQAAILLANTVLVPRVLVLAALSNGAVARRLLIPLGAMAACMLAGAAWRWRSARTRGQGEPELRLGNPFAILPALEWGALFAAVLLFAEGARRLLGDRGLAAAGAVAGLVDVDAITLSVSRSASAVAVPVLAIVLAVAANTVVKMAIAIGIGGWRFARPVALVSLCALAVALTLTVVL
jgi:uncharacterized membrane protein (DUF4010 family)